MLASTSEIYRSLVRSNCGVITEYRICRSKMMRTIVYLVVSVLSRVAKQDLLEASPPLISRGGLKCAGCSKELTGLQGRVIACNIHQYSTVQPIISNHNGWKTHAMNQKRTITRCGPSWWFSTGQLGATGPRRRRDREGQGGLGLDREG